jgi:hypothetical protein
LQSIAAMARLTGPGGFPKHLPSRDRLSAQPIHHGYVSAVAVIKLYRVSLDAKNGRGLGLAQVALYPDEGAAAVCIIDMMVAGVEPE